MLHFDNTRFNMRSQTTLQRIGIGLLLVGLALRLADRYEYLPEVAGYIDVFYWAGLAFWGFGFITRKKSSSESEKD